MRLPQALFQRSTRRNRLASRGQALVIFAMCSLVLFGALALAVDAGYLMAQRRGAQGAADAAALAAAKAVQRQQQSNAVATGQYYASANGFPNGSTNTVTISHPPSSGSRAGDALCVQATVLHNATRFFVGAIYTGTWTVSATGTACAELTARPYALVALEPGGDGLTSGGNSYLTITNGGALSDSDINICGTASWIQADGPLDAVSGITICSNADVEAATMTGNAAPMSDPLASVPEPSCGGASYPDPDIKNSTPSPITLAPGNYPNGITISGNNKTIIFQSGIYCFGDDLKTNGGASGNTLTSQGNSVLFLFRGDAVLNINGGGNHLIINSGPGGGCPSSVAACAAKIVIFYADGNCEDLWLVGGNNTVIDGIIYAPCSQAHLGGSSGSRIIGQVIVGEADIVGGSDLLIDYRGYVDTRVPLVYLVE